jgi:cysteinyl-tRNA synthetase
VRLYNTRTRGVEEFVPLRGDEVRIYVCGLTPSAQAHLGHARSFLFFDVLRRYLTHRGYRVKYVQNVTDIDDRSINAARENGEYYHDIVDRFYGEFKASMRKLHVLEYDDEPYATKYIAPIQAMIRELVERGHAYPAEDGIYYRVATFENYGKLANRNISELEAGARIEIDEHKEDPLDFALWKFAKPGEPHWPFEPYGEGRPGWHIECSAMARELLDREGSGFDIHGGGADLIFPHHENEIAQSEPLMKQPPMANFWVHGGLLLFDNRKMAKSLGNFEPLSQLLKRHDPQAIRWLFLQTGYRKVMNFTEDSIGAAGIGLARIKAAYRESTPATDGEPIRTRWSRGIDARMEAALDDDMNTAAAVAVLYEAVAHAPPSREELDYWLRILGIEPDQSWLDEPQLELPPDFSAKLAVELENSKEEINLAALTTMASNDAVDHVIALRNAARARKDWASSDRLREALQRSGIELKDSKEGTTWQVSS